MERRPWKQGFWGPRFSMRKVTGMNLHDDDDTHTDGRPQQPKKPSSPPDAPADESSLPEPAAVPSTRADLEATASPQSLSPFFASLPPEIRRMVYAQVWRAHLGEPSRMHIHAADRNGRLTHTPCCVAPAPAPAPTAASPDSPSSASADTTTTTTTPNNNTATADVSGSSSNDTEHGMSLRLADSPNPAPEWFWWAWCLRLRWGAHRGCQKRVMDRWDIDTGKLKEGQQVDKSGSSGSFMPLFVTCKRMYIESITTLFETTTLLFESSSDASLFLTPPPPPSPSPSPSSPSSLSTPHPNPHHRFISSLRHLELNLVYDKDHLYLWSIQAKHPRLSCCGTTTLVGIDVWDRLVEDLAAAAPNLQSLRVFVGDRSDRRGRTRERFLEAFETVGWRPRVLDLRFRDGE